MTAHPEQPILYSFRRCPYAIRARLAIAYSSQASGSSVELREVVLRDKPADMLTHSPKGTVPVLLLPDGRVVEESLDIMHWALRRHDPEHWLSDDSALRAETSALIARNDGEFKTHLDHYKYAVRHPEHPAEHYRAQAETTLADLDRRLSHHPWLLGNNTTLADIALLPFIRQFAFVDKPWFDQTPYPDLQRWLQTLLDAPLFHTVMQKTPPWVPEQAPAWFPPDHTQPLPSQQTNAIITLRPASPTDTTAIRAVTKAAFATATHSDHTEHFIVDALISNHALTVSLLAEVDGEVIAHIAISPVSISDGSDQWFGLGPISVLPAYQRQGIGTRLTEQALAALKDSGAHGCVVLGEPDFYQRFGFSAAADMVLPGVPAEYFQALCYSAEKPRGEVSYHQAFATQA